MKINDTFIKGLKIIEPNIFRDSRGMFIKTFTDSFFQENGLVIDIKETYYSISHQDVIRGMHFQIPPHEHIKLIYVPCGSILDVVLDIRKNSPTYGHYFSTEISASNGKVLIVPKGLAHGFKSLENNTNVVYMQTTGYSQEHDCGIKYNSFNFDWKCTDPKMSERDNAFAPFDAFESPFIDE
ncbi:MULTISPECIES: dTDP-4-dehydrorhamnose 3,5-epimerase family protein [unclassified Sulfurospirillum]|uniref:dTDP-4-dehydrorhamnose 3,5-epimerase family protein n=1 Tax=unclassified Sulfurospirillum TaxID=2618290 RepID=UPI000A7D4386|nr:MULTISPECIES: dTDP-4-dehydrorhamnose 3,5-epimerase family protein [unclassified Sulfurospirillum]